MLSDGSFSSLLRTNLLGGPSRPVSVDSIHRISNGSVRAPSSIWEDQVPPAVARGEENGFGQLTRAFLAPISTRCAALLVYTSDILARRQEMSMSACVLKDLATSMTSTKTTKETFEDEGGFRYSLLEGCVGASLHTTPNTTLRILASGAYRSARSRLPRGWVLEWGVRRRGQGWAHNERADR